jgi:hypothetical protein
MSSSDLRTAVVRELAEEFLERYRRGERPSLRDCCARHATFAAELYDALSTTARSAAAEWVWFTRPSRSRSAARWR